MQDFEKYDYTLQLLKTLWTLFLIALYAACFYNEYRFPGFRDEPLEGELVFWQIQRVFYFALIGLGFLTDLVQMRMDRKKAFMYLFASLILGGLATVIGAWQFRIVQGVFGGGVS